jgi:integrase
MSKPRRPENRKLPARWTYQHGAYYYRVPPGLEPLWGGKKFYRLGKTLAEAYRNWAEKQELPSSISTIGQLLDRYLLEAVPTKALKTQESNRYSIATLRNVFGEMLITSLTPAQVYKFVDLRSRKTKGADGRVRGGKITAHRDVEVLSHVFTKAIKWGLLNDHPFKGKIELDGEKPRTRYVEDWEVAEALTLVSKRDKGSVAMMQAYIGLKLEMGLRKSDMLSLTMSDMKEDGIYVTPRKTENSTAKKIVFEWTTELRAAVAAVIAVRPVLSPYLFCNRDGESYLDANNNTRGFNSIWQRFIKRVLSETKVTEQFNEHDLRAKVGSDETSAQKAQEILGHGDVRMTMRTYRRKAIRVKRSR